MSISGGWAPGQATKQDLASAVVTKFTHNLKWILPALVNFQYACQPWDRSKRQVNSADQDSFPRDLLLAKHNGLFEKVVQWMGQVS